jgi:hypothetical protein
MDDCIHNQVLKANKEAMSSSAYVALTTNEVINMDNQSWILIHGYVLKYWCQFVILLTIERIVDDFNFNSLTNVLIYSLVSHGGIYLKTFLKASFFGGQMESMCFEECGMVS